MKDEDKTKEQLIIELVELRQRIAELEALETDSRKAQEEIARAKAYLDNSLSSAPIGVMLVDKQTRFTYLNPTLLKWHGREAKDLIGKTVREVSPPLVSPETIEIVAERALKRVETGEPITGVEIEIMDKDGKRMPVSYSAAGIRDEKGDIIGEVVFVIDMTERKRAEELLRQRTHDLRERVKELNCHYAIANLIEKPGISLEQILQGTVDLITPAWQYSEITCARVILEGQEFRTENFRETPWKQACDIIVDGHRMGTLEVCHLEEKPERDEGPFLKEERSLLDAIAERLGRVTQRKQAEQALRESQEHAQFLADVLERSSQPFAIGYPDGQLMTYNTAYCKLLGYRKEELHKLKWSTDLTPPEWRDVVAKAEEEMRRTGQSQRFEKEYIRKDGSRVPVELLTHPILDSEGNLQYCYSFVTDVTERKRAEEEVAHYTKRMEALYAVAQVVSQTLNSDELLDSALEQMIEVMDADTGVVYLLDVGENAFLLKACKGTSEEVTRQISTIRLGEEELQKVLQWKDPNIPLWEAFSDTTLGMIAEAMEKLQVQSFAAAPWLTKGELRGVIAVGNRTHREFSPEDIDLLGGIGNQIGVAIENARLFTKERRLRQKLEVGMKRRVEFTRALVHELKTPLTAVLASSDLLVAELQEGPLLSLARNVNRGASNLNKRIDELLDLARGEIGILQLKPTRIDPQQLLHWVADDMAPVASSHGQALILDLPPSLPPIWADEVRLWQVLLNIVSNASKFTPEGGKITLRAREEDAFLIVQVQDTGHGIAEKEQQRLFEPYHRLESDRERLSGLGLGLALSKTLVELHGGRLWVESRVGEGSTFSFSVPLEAASQRAERP